ncbi:MAG: carboxypeptidase-like regulatory domain-containing protein [Planctomycetota bacterium]
MKIQSPPLSILAILFLLTGQALCFQGSSIEGVVRNGTTEAVMPQTQVTLTSPAGGLDSERRAETDADGRFRFDDVPLRGFYLARVVHDDIVYNAPVAFSDPSAPAKVELVVYDAGAPDEVPLRFTRIESTFRVLGREVEVERRYQVENPTTKALRGNSDALRFRLETIPPNLDSQAKQTAWLDVSVVPTADEQAHTIRFDIKPGLTDILMHYHLPYEDQRFLAEERLFHPASEVVLAVGPKGLDLAPGDQLEESGEVSGNTLFEAKDVQVGQSLTIGVSGEPAGLKIRGRVTNGTTGEPAAGVQLDLAEIGGSRHGGQGSPHEREEIPTWEGRTADDGTFSFEGLPPGESSFYVLRANYQGVDYSEHVRFQEATESEVELAVYDSVSRDEVSVQVDIPESLIYVDGRRLMFRAFYQILNSGNRTVAQEGAVRLALPEGAEEIVATAFSQIGDQSIPLQRHPRPVAGQANLYEMDWPIKPGQTTVGIQCLVPYDGSLALDIPMPDGVESILAMIGPMTVEVDSPDLRFDRSFKSQSSSDGSGGMGELRIFKGGPIKAGKSLRIELSGEGHSPGSVISARVPGSVDRLTMIIGPGIFLMLGIAIAFTFSGRASGATRREKEREQLLSELAALDDRFETKQLERGDYEEKRLALLGRIREIWKA